MKSGAARCISLSLVILVAWLQACSVEDEERDGAARVGVYDSRAIAVAFAGSPMQEKQLAELADALREAKEAGDAEKAKQLEAEGRARQAKAHAQAFSTAPVDEILALIEKEVAAIQEEASVVALVSKWDEASLKPYEAAERVDLTERLVDALQPTEKQRQSAMAIQKRKPISLEQAAKISD